MIQKQLINVLLELANASKSIKDDSDYYKITHKYDMLFLGKNFNVIQSLELRHCLSNYFKIEISNNELNDVIPQICNLLKMSYEPLVDVKHPNKLSCYKITLW